MPSDFETSFVSSFSDVQRRVSGRAREASNIVEQPGVEESDIEDDIDYSVKIYFTPSEWASMSLIVRNHAQNALKDYQTAKDKGIYLSFSPCLSSMS